MKLKDLAIDHDYYASDSNYYSNEAKVTYNNWYEFQEDYGEADIDMNLVFRWDIYKRDNDKGYWMQIIIIKQRKGVYTPIHINEVVEEDASQIIEFMKPHLEKILKIWQPISEPIKN